MTDSEILIKALFRAYNKLAAARSELDAINVFPVADADTGTNMTRTMKAGAESVRGDRDSGVCEILCKCSKAMLRNARGNSGVILSVLFKGFSDEAEKNGKIDCSSLESCFQGALSKAMDALSEPVMDKTILSLVLSAVKLLEKNSFNSFEEAWSAVTKECEGELKKTARSLSAQTESSVVDSGAKGLFIVIRAIDEILCSRGEIRPQPLKVSFTKRLAAPRHERQGALYCTEFIISSSRPFSAKALRRKLQDVGSSVAVVGDDDMVKVHVHTKEPDKAIAMALKLGIISDIKIDNMTLESQRKGGRI